MTDGDYIQNEIPSDVFECAIHLRNNITGLTTDGGSEAEYKLARKKLMDDSVGKRLLPDFVKHSTDAASVRVALSNVASGSGSWALRRNHVIEAFKPLLTSLEASGGAAALLLRTA